MILTKNSNKHTLNEELIELFRYGRESTITNVSFDSEFTMCILDKIRVNLG